MKAQSDNRSARPIGMLTWRRVVMWLGGLFAVQFAADVCAQNLLTNPDFNSPDIDDNGYSASYLHGDSASLAGWTIDAPAPTTGDIIQHGANWYSSGLPGHGDYIDLTGLNEGFGKGLFQAAGTTPGQAYNLSLWVGTMHNFGADLGSVEVRIDDVIAGTFTHNYQSNLSDWESFELQFIAATGSTKIGFYGSSANGSANNTIGLDNISLISVPEPGSLLLITSAAAVRFVRRRRRQP